MHVTEIFTTYWQKNYTRKYHENKTIVNKRQFTVARNTCWYLSTKEIIIVLGLSHIIHVAFLSLQHQDIKYLLILTTAN